VKPYIFATAFSLLGIAGCTTTVNATAPGCAADSSVGCSGNAAGYSCGNGDNPAHGDSSLVCSEGTLASDGFTLYCCVQFTTTTCSPDPSVNGCEGNSFGFSCTGADTPDEGDSSLNCSAPTMGNSGESLFCCQ
jgi:hypothetical protein